MRVIAVDWSGRLSGERRAIWLAEADATGALVRLECGRTREEVADHLVDLAETDDDVVVGIDCSFSLPAWFLHERGYATVQELWDAAGADGERWLADCNPPFWGQPGRTRPEVPAHFRATEQAIASIGGIRPKSTFQIGGAGSVGSGSIRGFPILSRLRERGFRDLAVRRARAAHGRGGVAARLHRTGGEVGLDGAAGLRRHAPSTAPARTA